MLDFAAIDSIYGQHQSLIEEYYAEETQLLEKLMEDVDQEKADMYSRCANQLDVPENTDGSTSGGNNRRIQDLGDRKLFMFERDVNEQENYLDSKSGASALMASFAAIAAAAALSF